MAVSGVPCVTCSSAASSGPTLWLQSPVRNSTRAQARMAERGGSLPAAAHFLLTTPSWTVGQSAVACGPRSPDSDFVLAGHGIKDVQWEGFLKGCAIGIGAFVAAMIMPEAASAVEASAGNVASQFTELLAREPANALSLPTWTIHVASVAEWITAMSLVWQYGDTPGNAAWKGLAWGMVPLLGGAMCACTWHFFYNADSLAELVVLQGALTLTGNLTMWIAAFRIYLTAEENRTAP